MEIMSRNHYRRNSYNRGYEKARQHIEEAAALTKELGGTDQDVKEWFFSLERRELRPILNEYGSKYGFKARDYAEKTLRKWESGRVQMSGLVASRLFNILPGYMPTEKKFSLVRSLWKSQCPNEIRTLRVGPDAQAEEVAGEVKRNLEDLVQSYQISSSIRKRFKWLAHKDSTLQEDLENHFMQQRREILSDAIQNRVPMLISQIRQRGMHSGINQTITVGNYKLLLQYQQKAKGVSRAPATTVKNKARVKDSNGGCLAVVLVVIAVITIASFC